MWKKKSPSRKQEEGLGHGLEGGGTHALHKLGLDLTPNTTWSPEYCWEQHLSTVPGVALHQNKPKSKQQTICFLQFLFHHYTPVKEPMRNSELKQRKT